MIGGAVLGVIGPEPSGATTHAVTRYFKSNVQTTNPNNPCARASPRGFLSASFNVSSSNHEGIVRYSAQKAVSQTEPRDGIDRWYGTLTE